MDGQGARVCVWQYLLSILLVDLLDPVGNSEIILKSELESFLNGEPCSPELRCSGQEVTSSYPMILVHACSALLSAKTQRASFPGLAQRVG